MTHFTRPLLGLLTAVTALPAAATTYTQFISLVGCRSVPSTHGFDPVTVDAADAGAVTLAYVSNNQTIDSTSQMLVVCDLRLPPTATQLRSVTLEYLRFNRQWISAETKLEVFLAEQLTPALPYQTKTRYHSAKIGSCLATTPDDQLSTLFTCTAATNQTLVPYNDFVFSGSKLVPNDHHDLFSAYATVAMAFATDGENSGSPGNAYRLRVAFDAP